MATLRAFYAGLGWQERPGSNDDFAAYEAGATLVTLYPLQRLGGEAAPGELLPASGWNGVTFGVNVENARAVDDAFHSAVAAGAQAVADPVKREWGGYSAYFADPEGNRWEITWAPDH
jgi:predicted lactoylglutathione lyase